MARAADVNPSMKASTYDTGVVTAFIEAINLHDVDALTSLMSEDHVFIDSSGRCVSGRDEVAAGWKAYFAMFPDFAIRADATMTDSGTVAVFGSVSGTYNGKRGLVPQNRISMPAAWQAIVSGGRVKQWQVYCDWTEGMRIIGEDKRNG